MKQTKTDAFRHSATYSDAFRHSATYSDTFRHSAARSDAFRHSATRSDVFRHSATYSDAFRHSATRSDELPQNTTKFDTHTHTDFSPDGCETPRKLIETAIDSGLTHICITDHTDIMTVGSSGEGVTDLAAYAAAVRALKNEYADRIYVSVGIECGHTRANEQKNAALLKDAGIEYVINSVHEVNGSDIYLDSHYMNRSKRNVYTEYLEAVLQSLYAPYKFAALGHAGYMSRRAPYADNALTYSEFPVLTDAVIDRLIKTETILEINTARGRSASAVLPDPSVLARYYERGGRLVTLGSDAHRISELCRGFDGARILARGIGFTEFTLIQNDNFKAVRI